MKRTLALILVLALASGLLAEEPPRTEELLRGYGTLDPSDERGPDGRTQDRYSLTAPRDGTISVTVVSPDLAPGLAVSVGGRAERESAGENAAHLFVDAGSGESVSVTVYDPIGAGVADYIVVARYVAAGGDPRLVPGVSLAGELTSGDERNRDGSYVDEYDLAVSRGERVRVDLSSDDFDTYLRVELPDGRIVENDDSSGTDSSLSFTAGSDGTARVEVTSYSFAATGAYRIGVTLVDQRSVRTGQSIEGELRGSGDEYLLVGTPGETVTIELESFDFDTYLELTDPSGTYLSNDDAEGFSLSRLAYEIGEAGEATITASSFGDGTGAYVLRVERYEYTGPRIPDGYRLTEGESVAGELGPHLPVTDGAYRQRFTFRADRRERIEIVLRSDDFDSFLTVVTPGGREITDDDSAGGLDSRVVLTTEERGVYEIYASALGGDAIGEYTIGFDRKGETRLLLDTRGELSRDDATDILGRYYDTYRFTVNAGRLVTIDVVSDDFDGYAVVRTASGEVLYRDDDGGNGSNPQISFSADQSQTLELVVTSYSEGATGRYSVSIYE